MSPRGKSVVALVLAFGLGGVAGGFGMRALKLGDVNQLMRGPTPEARRNFMLDVLTRRLELNETQAAQVGKIFEAHEAERRQAFEKCRPEHDAIKARITAEIDAVLDPRQRELHSALRAELESRRRGERSGPGK